MSTLSTEGRKLSVHAFSKDTLIELIRSSRSLSAIISKPQVSYLAEYLEIQRCVSIIAEHPYVDRDFLEDYSAYYVRCFSPYERFCRRLHFFNIAIEEKDLSGHLEGSSTRLAECAKASCYLGFCVIKPLPDAIIGRTCLAVYPSDEGRRQYPCTREYHAHLAGLTFSVHSLAFQEQDTVLAACATTAVWSALHKAGKLFDSPIPTPGRITALATQFGDLRNRVLPSRGLDLGQIVRAIQAVGLEVEVREGDKGDKIDDLKGLVYAYGKMGLPIILGVEKYREGSERRLEPDGDAHAVTVAGYSILSGSSRSGEPAEKRLTSARINEFYVHDDQTGPFVAAPIVQANRIVLPWDGRKETLTVFVVVIPVYPKMRVTYEWAKELVLGFSLPFEELNFRLHWDISLSNCTQLASDHERNGSAGSRRRRVLEGNWPRFVWRATASFGGKDLVEIIIDSTDMERSFGALSLLFLDDRFAKVCSRIVGSSKVSAWFASTSESRGSEWLLLMKQALQFENGHPLTQGETK